MKNLTKALLVFFALIISIESLAQKEIRYLESNQSYSKGKIYLRRSLVPIGATRITLLNDTLLRYIDSATGIENTLNVYRSSVNYVKIKTGTRAGEFALYGGLLMGLSATYAILQTELDYGTGSTEEFRWGFLGGFTAGGILIGGVIGAFAPKYRNFYIRNKQIAYSVTLTPAVYNGKAVGMGFRVTF